jgi:hypothetical protein
MAALCVLGLAAGRTWAQSVGEEFDGDCTLGFVRQAPSPSEGVLGMLLLSIALLPLVVAWSSTASGRHESARRWTATALVLAFGQALYGLYLMLEPGSFVAVPSWLPGMEELQDLLHERPEWVLYLGVGSLGATAAWWTIKVIDARRIARPRLVAGTRIRVPAAKGEGAAP